MATSKKTVLILVNHEVVIYNFRLELAERLLADGHEVHISCPYGEKIDELVKLGCIHHDIAIARHGTNPITDGKLILHYVKLMKKVKPDMVFSYTIKPNIYGGIACRLLNVPQVANVTGLGTAVENPGWTLKLMSHATGLVNKAFGNLSYDQQMSVYKEPYQKYSLEEAIEKTEK